MNNQTIKVDGKKYAIIKESNTQNDVLLVRLISDNDCEKPFAVIKEYEPECKSAWHIFKFKTFEKADERFSLLTQYNMRKIVTVTLDSGKKATINVAKTEGKDHFSLVGVLDDTGDWAVIEDNIKTEKDAEDLTKMCTPIMCWLLNLTCDFHLTEN